MTDYLQESAEALRVARSFAATASSPAINSDAVKADLHLRVADGFARLAAIERGLLLPPETVPDEERAAC